MSVLGKMFRPDLKEGDGYLLSRGIVIEDVLQQGVESIMNGVEKEGERMDYIWGRGLSDRRLMFVDAVVDGGVRKFSVVRFRDIESREMFIIRYRLYGDSVLDAGLMLRGRIN